MNQYVIDTKIKDGFLSLKNLPFKEDIEVKVIVIPKINFEELSFSKVRKLTSAIKDNMSDEIVSERKEE